MEIILNKDQAVKAVGVAKNFAAGASGLKVLQGAFLSAGFGRVRLVTTDLEVWCQVELKAQTPRPGKVLVPVRGLATVLKNAPHSCVQLRSVWNTSMSAKASLSRNAGRRPVPDIWEATA